MIVISTVATRKVHYLDRGYSHRKAWNPGRVGPKLVPILAPTPPCGSLDSSAVQGHSQPMWPGHRTTSREISGRHVATGTSRPDVTTGRARSSHLTDILWRARWSPWTWGRDGHCPDTSVRDGRPGSTAWEKERWAMGGSVATAPAASS